ncbi:hypothetical protein MIDIC_400002 [Alphaproteobacteria bacterium]
MFLKPCPYWIDLKEFMGIPIVNEYKYLGMWIEMPQAQKIATILSPNYSLRVAQLL